VNGPVVNGGVVGTDTGSAPITEAAARVAAAGESRPRPAPDPVNLPMIRHWVEAMGDTNPIYTDAGAAARSVHGGLVAPPAMARSGRCGGCARQTTPMPAIRSAR